MVCTSSCERVLLYVYLSINLVVVFIQIPWLAYFLVKFLQARNRLAQLMRIDMSEGCQNLLQKYENTKILYKYFIAATTFELLTMSLTVFNIILNPNPLKDYLHCKEYYFIMYLYGKYFIGFLSVLCLMSSIEVLNFTTKFATNVFILNIKDGNENKIRIFIMKLVLLVMLALSGIGMIAFILVEILLVKESIQYYQNSRELYKKLRMMYEDVKYEFGDTHINTRSARKNLLHYKRFTIWISVVVFLLVIASILFAFWTPFYLIGEPCVLETFTQYKYNSTSLDFIHYKDIKKGAAISSIIIRILIMISFIPFYTLYSLYYLCDKLLFVNVYPHIYHVGSSVGSDNINDLLIKK